jgi:hypothetical protein
MEWDISRFPLLFKRMETASNSIAGAAAVADLESGVELGWAWEEAVTRARLNEVSKVAKASLDAR